MDSNTSLERIKQIWNRLAPLYPKMIHSNRLEQEISRISLFADINTSDRIVSLGSGIALSEVFLAKNFVPNGFVTCVDISPEMNKFAKKIQTTAGVENMKILTKSAATTGLPTDSQNKVIIGLIGHQEPMHLIPVLNESLRLLKKSPTSKLIFTFGLNPGKDSFKICKLLSERGFHIEELQPYYALFEGPQLFMLIASFKSNLWKKTKLVLISILQQFY